MKKKDTAVLEASEGRDIPENVDADKMDFSVCTTLLEGDGCVHSTWPCRNGRFTDLKPDLKRPG